VEWRIRSGKWLKKDAWTLSMVDLLKAETIHMICRTGCRAERGFLKELLYVGRGGGGVGDLGGGRILVASRVWYRAMVRINMGRHKHWLFFSPRIPTHCPENTQTHTNVRQKGTWTNYWTVLAFFWVQRKGNKSLLAKHDETKSWPRGKINN